LRGRKDFGPIKNPVAVTLKRFSSRTGGGGPEGEPATRVHLEKLALKWKW